MGSSDRGVVLREWSTRFVTSRSIFSRSPLTRGSPFGTSTRSLRPRLNADAESVPERPRTTSPRSTWERWTVARAPRDRGVQHIRDESLETREPVCCGFQELGRALGDLGGEVCQNDLEVALHDREWSPELVRGCRPEARAHGLGLAHARLQGLELPRRLGQVLGEHLLTRLARVLH